MKKILISALLILLFQSSSLLPQDSTQQKIRRLFEKELKNEKVHNAFFAVYSNKLNLNWNWAEGEFKDGSPVSAENPFHSASIGKTFTATTIVLLQEEGKLQFQDPIKNYLAEEVMDSLHLYEGKDYSDEISIAHLLQHRSGLPDYFEDKPEDGPSMIELLITDTAHFWTPMELLLFAKHGMQAHFAPGTAYHYSDTEYILLGMIIESISGKPLHQVFKERFFLPLEMRNSSMHLRSRPLQETGKMAELYLGNTEISSYTSLSLDWAGGGLLTTCEDLLKFDRALMQGELIKKSSLLGMQNWTPESKAFYYGYGLRKMEMKELFFTLPNVSLIGHSGSTGSFMYYCPEWDIYFTGTFNQTDYLKKHVQFLAKVLTVLRKTAAK